MPRAYEKRAHEAIKEVKMWKKWHIDGKRADTRSAKVLQKANSALATGTGPGLVVNTF